MVRGRAIFYGYFFETVTELWVSFSQFLDISRNYGCPFQGIFDNFRNYGPRYSFDLWNYDPKIHQNLRNYGYQFLGQNGTSPSHNRLSTPPPRFAKFLSRSARGGTCLLSDTIEWTTRCFHKKLVYKKLVLRWPKF